MCCLIKKNYQSVLKHDRKCNKNQKMMILSFSIALICLITVPVNGKVLSKDKILTFWQISDIHLDAFYNVHGDPENWCHYHYNNTNNSSLNNNISTNNSSLNNNTNSYKFNLGKYGNFECESNWDLLTSAFELMKSQNGDPGTT